jgi:hypothetical protein
VDTEEQKSGLPAFSSNTRGLIGGLIASPLAVYFYCRGDTGRALLSLVAGAALIFIISARWNLRKLKWFWVTIAIIVGINLALIILVPSFSSHGIRGPVLAPIGAVLGGMDYFLVSMAIKVMQPRTAKEP